MSRNRLILDIGNSRIKCGVFQNRELSEFFLLSPEMGSEKCVEIVQKQNVDTIFCAGSGDIDKIYNELSKMLKGDSPVIKMFSPNMATSIRLNYTKPDMLGSDRLAGIVAIHSMQERGELPASKHSLLIDIGTCVCYDILHPAGIHLGGMISPGAGIRLKGMHDYTDKLPLVEPDMEQNFPAFETRDAIRVGAMQGLIMEIRGMIEIVRGKYSELNVVLCGGGALYLSQLEKKRNAGKFDIIGDFVRLMKKEIFVHPNLVLRGFNEICILNER